MGSRVSSPALFIIGLLLAAFVAAACGPSPEEIDARIATAVASLSTPTPAPTATPQPTATPAALLTPLPTATPVPTATPQPTPTRISIPTPLPTPTPIPTPTPQPTATAISLPALVAITSAASADTSVPLSQGVSLTISPGRPIAGRDIAFTLSGLQPWQSLDVTFISPSNSEVEWITDYETTYTHPVYTRTLRADAEGTASWTRVADRDVEGIWRVRLSLDGQPLTVTYPVAQLQLEVTPQDRLGISFRLYRGSVTDSYVSSLVPAALALDLQHTLAAVTDDLGRALGVQSRQIPDLYLLSNAALFQAAAQASGRDPPDWAAGFFSSQAPYPGIFIKTDAPRTSLQQTLIHEHVHLLLAELAPSVDLPAWLDEGAATYYELLLGLTLERPDIPRRESFERADLVKEAIIANTLIPLTQLESQQLWARRTGDAVTLQYSEAYMGVRYIFEQFGEPALTRLVARLNAGDSLNVAFQTTTGVTYQQFQSDYVAWAKDFQDPGREAVRAFYLEASDIMDDWRALAARRGAEIATGANLPPSSRVAPKQALVADATALRDRAALLAPPETLAGLNADLNAFLGRTVEWLQLELDWIRTLVDAKRVQANSMIPEIDGRELGVREGLSDLEFVYRLSP